MSDATRLLDAVAAGDRQASAALLPLVYDELRKLAAIRMAAEAPGHTLDGTALVHEAYLRLVGPQDGERWQNRGHFFAAAAEAMRRILVESARRRTVRERVGNLHAVQFADSIVSSRSDSELLAVHEVLDQLADHDPAAAELVKLHIFVGLSLEQTAEVLGLSVRTVYRNWAYAKAWMFRCLGGA